MGQACTCKLQARLADLDAASSVRGLVVGRPHPLRGDRIGQFALDLEGGKRLVFKAANEPVPLKNDGSIDWSQATKVCIIFVRDYHD
ncbi:Putative killer suppression protein HigA [Gloeomargarita lithophora Alchichica-D10]|uniref:Killer suppression protein HigA n=1 Tax=Gloeomargarita lithophora Alchichica-D10 TaxID=1188229 RepID=A0A1J0A8Z1_9CYAN|nr:Putative killer suppression protein HigA [Gloeomargarita lithophora Alchichica-D10]